MNDMEYVKKIFFNLIVSEIIQTLLAPIKV